MSQTESKPLLCLINLPLNPIYLFPMEMDIIQDSLGFNIISELAAIYSIVISK